MGVITGEIAKQTQKVHSDIQQPSEHTHMQNVDGVAPGNRMWPCDGEPRVQRLLYSKLRLHTQGRRIYHTNEEPGKSAWELPAIVVSGDICDTDGKTL